MEKIKKLIKFFKKEKIDGYIVPKNDEFFSEYTPSYKDILNFIGTTYKTVNDYGFDNIDPHVVRYFRNEYGKDWKSALTEHLFKKERSNDKKAA